MNRIARACLIVFIVLEFTTIALILLRLFDVVHVPYIVALLPVLIPIGVMVIIYAAESVMKFLKRK